VNQRIFADPSPAWPAREIALQFQRGTLRFVEPLEWVPPEDADLNQRLAFQDALLAWTLVRELPGLPEPALPAEKGRR
jgi:hypothetical protein